MVSGKQPANLAQVLRISAVTVKRDLRTARAWLYCELTGGTDDGFRTV